MKKVLALTLSIMLCLSLCACGGMAGEKAAQMYPDIIGEWGTDPFGEEFVLTLSKDGSCIILDNTGTWTLNKKNSNEEQVGLVVKTENMKYHVEMLGYKSGYPVLTIMDSKEETEIFRGEVFKPGDDYIFADLAIQTVPELIGEWGTAYWNDESILTINEDGTCALFRQPGKWCLYTYMSTWPDIRIFIKLDNGQQYSLPFSMLDGEWGYNIVDMRIFSFSEDTYLLSDPERDYPVFRVVNRAQLIQPMDVASAAVGEWAEDENSQPFATFREDGTCTIRGADGLWTLDYTAYYNEKNRNGWDYCLHAKISGDEYDICFGNPDDSGKCSMYILNQDDDIYILDCSEVIKIGTE